MMNVKPCIQNAYKVLEGQNLTREEALELAYEVHGEDILDLISLANKVRHRFAEQITPCSIINGKSGKCSENCKFCAQSAYHHTGIETYPLLPREKVLEAAEKAYNSGIRRFGYVLSGVGFKKTDDPEFRQILDTLDYLHEKLPGMAICVSMGILSRECVQELAKHHVWRYNMNLQTNPERYHELIATTHSIEDKIRTVEYLKEAGITNCTGGIYGLGETWEDRVDMAFAVKKLDVEGSPLNVLLPIPGSALENQEILHPAEVAKCFAIFRLINPTKMIKFAAGRETVMKDFQGLLMLSGLNAKITGGYLTTRGRSVADDMKFMEQLNEF